MSTKAYYEKYWQSEKNYGEGHAKHIPKWPERELRMFYKSIQRFIGKRVLDIGSGEGIFLEYLQKNHNGQLVLSALELSSVAAEKGQKRNPAVNYKIGSADDKYAFKDSEFDTIFMTDVIEHLVDVDEAISECGRVLEQGGKIILITPNFNLPKKIFIATFFWEKFFHPTNPHIRFFTQKSLDSIFEKHGFRRIYSRWGLTWFKIMPQNGYFVYEKRK
jgi:2-polyprenyl-3-methyl-5-hydroxy-6-metoxy-1,4-benzoquinol methylase